MEPPRKHMSSGVPIKEEVELEDGNVKDLLVKRRRTKAPDSLPVDDSTGKDPMNVLTSCAVQHSGQANGPSNERASLRLLKICTTMGWREPSFAFEEQGPSHMKIFRCRVTVHVNGLEHTILKECLSNPKANTILECFSDPTPKKRAAKEHAAQGALWFLHRTAYAN